MAAASAAPRIFVSYARSDGKEIAAELRRRLQDEHGFPLWQDLADLEGGKDWWLQITDAIDHVEFLVLVMTSAALGSEYVRREWRYARQQGKCVIPVIGAKGIDFDSLPGWMRRAHFVDPDEPDQWRRFVRTLEAPCKATRAPFMVEDLPDRCSSAARASSSSWSPRCSTRAGEEPVAITAALQGRRRLRQDHARPRDLPRGSDPERLRRRHPLGHPRRAAGRRPEPRRGPDRSPHQRTAGLHDTRRRRHAPRRGHRRAAHADRDRRRLAGGACPPVPAGRAELRAPDHHAQPRCPAAQRASLSMSTPWRRARRSSCCASASRMARTPPSRSLAQRLGEWPLLLKLVNGALHKRVAAGQPLAAALAWVNAGARQPRAHRVSTRAIRSSASDAVAKTLGVSLELFTEDERARFSELAIFPEDVDVPLAVVETLWSRTAGFDEFETEALCTRLYDQSLLLEPRSRHAPHPPARRDPRLLCKPSRKSAFLHSTPSWSKPTARAVRTAGIRGRTTAISSSTSPTTLPKPGGRTSAARCCSTTAGCAGSWRSRASTG